MNEQQLLCEINNLQSEKQALQKQVEECKKANKSATQLEKEFGGKVIALEQQVEELQKGKQQIIEHRDGLKEENKLIRSMFVVDKWCDEILGDLIKEVPSAKALVEHIQRLQAIVDRVDEERIERIICDNKEKCKDCVPLSKMCPIAQSICKNIKKGI